MAQAAMTPTLADAVLAKATSHKRNRTGPVLVKSLLVKQIHRNFPVHVSLGDR